VNKQEFCASSWRSTKVRTIPVTREYSKPDELAQTFYRLAWLGIEGFILFFAKEVKTVSEFRVFITQTTTTVFLLSPERRECAPEKECHNDFMKIEGDFKENSAERTNK
jgi:hypothetical protein